MTAEVRAGQAVRPGARPIAIDAGPDAVLLCHGFTASPATLRPWATDLAARGFTVRAPLLPGHGTAWPDLERVRWQEWDASVEAAWHELRREHARVFVAGLSMGGCLALRLAERHPEVAGVILVNPAVASRDPRLRLAGPLAHVVRTVRGVASDIAKPGMVEPDAYQRTPVRAVGTMVRLWDEVCANLGSVRQPLLYFRSRVDHVVDQASIHRILRGVRSDDVTVRLLARSYHVATLDHDAPAIFAESAAWLARHCEAETA